MSEKNSSDIFFGDFTINQEIERPESSLTFKSLRSIIQEMNDIAVKERVAFLDAIGVDHDKLNIKPKSVIFLPIERERQLSEIAPMFVRFSRLIPPNKVIVADDPDNLFKRGPSL